MNIAGLVPRTEALVRELLDSMIWYALNRLLQLIYRATEFYHWILST